VEKSLVHDWVINGAVVELTADVQLIPSHGGPHDRNLRWAKDPFVLPEERGLRRGDSFTSKAELAPMLCPEAL